MIQPKLAFALTISIALIIGVSAQSVGTNAATTNLLGSLPESDAVAWVNVSRVLDEAMPTLLSANPTKLNEVNAELERFKTRTGLDPRSFKQLAVGMRYSYPSPGITKVNTVGIAEGTFNPEAMVAAGRIAADGKYREETYKGKKIYLFSLDQHIKLLGVLNLRFNEIAVTSLTNTTLAIGDLERVQAVIDTAGTGSRANAELITLASREPNAIFSFGGNITPTLIENIGIGNDAIAKDVSSVRQVYGSMGMTAKNYEMFLAARTDSADSAKNLSSTIEGLKQLGALFINRLPAARGVLAQSALTNLKVTTVGNELQVRTGVAQADVAPVLGGR